MLPTTTSTSPLAPSADRGQLNTALNVIERLATQFPQFVAAGVDRRAMVAEWALGLADLRRAEVERGIAQSRTRRFAPSLGEFCHLCRPALDPEYAWQEAGEGLRARRDGELGVWSHPAVFRAASALSWDLRTRSFRDARVAWQRQLELEFSKGWGDDVPPIPQQVEHRPTVKPMPPAVRKRVAELLNRGLR